MLFHLYKGFQPRSLDLHGSFVILDMEQSFVNSCLSLFVRKGYNDSIQRIVAYDLNKWIKSIGYYIE